MDERGRLLFKNDKRKAQQQPQQEPEAETLCYYSLLDGKGRWLLTKAGIAKCVAQMRDDGQIISEESLQYEVDPHNRDYVLFVTKASLTHNGQKSFAIGTKRQWKYRVLSEDCEEGWRGDVVFDRYWFEKGSEKALVNAKRKLIPFALQQKVIDESRGAVVADDDRNMQLSRSREDCIAYYVKFQRWLDDELPFAVTVIEGGRRCSRMFTWRCLLESESDIVTRSGRVVGLHQYLHMLEGYQHKKDSRLGYKACAALVLHKERNSSAIWSPHAGFASCSPQGEQT